LPTGSQPGIQRDTCRKIDGDVTDEGLDYIIALLCEQFEPQPFPAGNVDVRLAEQRSRSVVDTSDGVEMEGGRGSVIQRVLIEIERRVDKIHLNDIIGRGGVAGSFRKRRVERLMNSFPQDLLDSISQWNFLGLSAGIAVANRQVFDRLGNLQLGTGR